MKNQNFGKWSHLLLLYSIGYNTISLETPPFPHDLHTKICGRDPNHPGLTPLRCT